MHLFTWRLTFECQSLWIYRDDLEASLSRLSLHPRPGIGVHREFAWLFDSWGIEIHQLYCSPKCFRLVDTSLTWLLLQLRRQGGAFPGAGGGRSVQHLGWDFLLSESFGGFLQNSQHRSGESGPPQRPPSVPSTAVPLRTQPLPQPLQKQLPGVPPHSPPLLSPHSPRERASPGTSYGGTMNHCVQCENNTPFFVMSGLNLLCLCVQKPRLAHALCDYTPPHTAHLHFLRGDIIDLLDCSSHLSWRGRCRGRVGIFPPEFVQPLYHWRHIRL